MSNTRIVHLDVHGVAHTYTFAFNPKTKVLKLYTYRKHGLCGGFWSDRGEVSNTVGRPEIPQQVQGAALENFLSNVTVEE